MRALIIIDMLVDFYDGALANKDEADKIIPGIQRLLEHARESDDWVVVYSNDAHHLDDPDVPIWGEHAMAGTPGAEVMDALAPIGGDREIISLKRCYSAFDDEQLEDRLRELGVDEVVVTGQHTHCCVRHTSYDAFRRGFKLTAVSDGCAAFPGIDNDAALDYLKTIYHAEVTNSASLTSEAPEVA